jgi:hypothetical protein
METLQRCIARATQEWRKMEEQAFTSRAWLDGTVAEYAADVVVALLDSPEIEAAVQRKMAVREAA